MSEFERQIRTYVSLGLPDVIGTDEAGFRAAAEPLRAHLPDDGVPDGLPEDDYVPFVLVVAADVYDAVPAMRRGARHGVSMIGRAEAAEYRPIDGAEIPDGAVYLLIGIDTGSEFRGVPPREALATLRDRDRAPLTMSEGVALATVRPDMLRSNKCFSLLASRANNRRVPAIWISEGHPKLGWCWDGNPHTWLGAASATRRVGAQ